MRPKEEKKKKKKKRRRRRRKMRTKEEKKKKKKKKKRRKTRRSRSGRRFVRFCAEVAGVPEADALPRQRGSDLNRDLVCLFIAHAVGRYTTSTVTGTLSTLADWQRFMGVSPEAYISRDPLVKRTLGQALRRTAAGPESAPSMAKAPLPLGVLRLLVAWLR
ncbi:hypothetical protein VOLCADRAFT_101480, partial [Volvox carteri f. nagariensis]